MQQAPRLGDRHYSDGIWCSSGAEVGSLKRVNGEVDLILTDLIMPNISGVGIIAIAKKKYPDVPIIAITGQGRHAVDLAMESPVDMVLEKPIDLEALDQAIESLILTSVTRKQHQKDISIKQ